MNETVTIVFIILIIICIVLLATCIAQACYIHELKDQIKWYYTDMIYKNKGYTDSVIRNREKKTGESKIKLNLM